MTISPNARTVWRNYVTDGVPSSGNHKVKKSATRTWGTAVETRLAAVSTAAKLYQTRANLYADLTEDANTLAWVYGDSTVSYNGIYMKVGSSGSGSWTRVGDLPYSFVIGTDLGAGTANAIQITTDIPVADGMIVAFSLFEATTSSPVTVSINGGAALTLKDSSGANARGLTANQEVWGRYKSSDNSFRLINPPLLYATGTDAGAGTANAISVTTTSPVSDGTLVVFSLFEDTTSSPATVSFNGGAALTIKTSRGNNASGLTAGQDVWGRVNTSTSTFRLLTDQDVSALVAQAEAARDIAVAAANGMPPRYLSRSSAEAANVTPSADYITVIHGGLELSYIRDASGTALTTGDGATWSPLGDATPEHWGVVGDGSDETTAIHAMAEWTSARGRLVFWGNKTYAFTEIYVRADVVDVFWRTRGRTILRSLKTAPSVVKSGFSAYEADAAIDLIANSIRDVPHAISLNARGARVTVDDTSDITPGDTLAVIQSTRVIETDNRGQARHGWTVAIDRIIDGTTIQLAKPIPVTCKVGDITGVTVVSVSGQNVVVSGLSAYSRTDVQYRLRFNTVGGVSQTDVTRWPKKFDKATQTYTFDSTNGPVPVGLAAGDSITVERRVDIGLRRSVKMDIQPGFILERAPHTGATGGDYGFRGLRVVRGLRPRILGLQVRNFSETGISVYGCYSPQVVDVHVEGANRAYDGADGTGYGVSCFQSSWGTFKDIQGFGCRRTLDFSGTQGVSFYNEAENIHGYGGGEAYDGERFHPVGSTDCSVAGSHGAGYGTRYRAIRGFNVVSVVNLRGFDEEVRGVYGAGQITRLVNSFYGDGGVVDGLYYSDGVPDWASSTDYDYGYSNGGKLTAALRIEASSIIPTKPHMLSNIHLRGVKRSLIDIEGTGTVGPIVVSGSIDIITDNEDGDLTTFDLIRNTGGGTVKFSGPIRVGSITLLNSPTAPKGTINLVNQTDFDLQGNYWKYGTQYFLTIGDDSFAKIPCTRFGTTRMSLRMRSRDRSPVIHVNDAEVWLERTGDKSAVPNSANVAILDTALTGTTGTDGQASISYGPSGEATIYIENRYGSSQQFVFECDAAL